jgi:hypothetical protein
MSWRKRNNFDQSSTSAADQSSINGSQSFEEISLPVPLRSWQVVLFHRHIFRPPTSATVSTGNRSLSLILHRNPFSLSRVPNHLRQSPSLQWIALSQKRILILSAVNSLFSRFPCLLACVVDYPLDFRSLFSLLFKTNSGKANNKAYLWWSRLVSADFPPLNISLSA